MKKHFLFAALMGLMTFAACDSEETVVPEPPQQEETTEEPKEEILPGEENIYEAAYGRRKEIRLDEAQKEISTEVNKFAWKMFAKTFEGREETNLMASPYSLIQNLLMLSNGVGGETLDEIKAVLEIEEFDMEEVNQYILQFNEGMVEADPRTRYRTDNSVWFQNHLTMQPHFAEKIAQYYKAETFPATMSGATLDSINTWAKERTYGRIPYALDNLAPSTQAVLMNTVYFRGLWQEELGTKMGKIYDGIFYSETGEEQKARMVPYPELARYTEGETFQSTNRNFGNGAYTMDFILPNEGVSASDALAEYMEKMDEKPDAKIVFLSFPCFETANKIDLFGLLQSMGIKRMFDSKCSGDFCLFDAPSFIGTVIQKTSITVDEHGAEAATTTYSSMMGDTGESYETVSLTLDRPFFYTIRETSTNTPLFIGYQGSVAK